MYKNDSAGPEGSLKGTIPRSHSVFFCNVATGRFSNLPDVIHSFPSFPSALSLGSPRRLIAWEDTDHWTSRDAPLKEEGGENPAGAWGGMNDGGGS